MVFQNGNAVLQAFHVLLLLPAAFSRSFPKHKHPNIRKMSHPSRGKYTKGIFPGHLFQTIYFLTWSCCAAQAGLKSVILLPHPPLHNAAPFEKLRYHLWSWRRQAIHLLLFQRLAQFQYPCWAAVTPWGWGAIRYLWLSQAQRTI